MSGAISSACVIHSGSGHCPRNSTAPRLSSRRALRSHPAEFFARSAGRGRHHPCKGDHSDSRHKRSGRSLFEVTSIFARPQAITTSTSAIVRTEWVGIWRCCTRLNRTRVPVPTRNTCAGLRGRLESRSTTLLFATTTSATSSNRRTDPRFQRPCEINRLRTVAESGLSSSMIRLCAEAPAARVVMYESCAKRCTC